MCVCLVANSAAWLTVANIVDLRQAFFAKGEM